MRSNCASCVWAGPNCHLVHYPLRGGEQYNLVAVFHSRPHEEGWSVERGQPEELQVVLRRHRTRTVAQLLDVIDDWKLLGAARPRARRRRGRSGRVTLLGDAAHPMLQYLAQGACMAIEDAVVSRTR